VKNDEFIGSPRAAQALLCLSVFRLFGLIKGLKRVTQGCKVVFLQPSQAPDNWTKEFAYGYLRTKDKDKSSDEAYPGYKNRAASGWAKV
jgi:hypothetical protein